MVMSALKSVRFLTLGCQMNVYDSERMAEELALAGYRQAPSFQEADLIVVNTCSIRDKPVEKVFSALGRLRAHKKRRSNVRIVVAGCVARQEGKRILQRAPWVDLVMGPDHICDIVELLELQERTGQGVVATDYIDEGGFAPRTAVQANSRRASAFVTIIKGCNQFCSYCIVPRVRGREHSKPADAVLDECRMLLDSGVKEITLLGQNVNRYGRLEGEVRFPELLRRVHELPGLQRLGFMTSHPSGVDDDLVACYRDLPKLTPYLHLPIQSGSDRLLERMNRGYSFQHYRNCWQQLSKARPGLMLSTDIIVGFSGETEQDFEATLAAAEEIRWGMAYVFKYNPRPGTKAATWPDDVPEEVKQSRFERILQVVERTMREAMQAHVGKVHELLLEGEAFPVLDGETRHQWFGRTPTRYVVNVPAENAPGPLAIGESVKVRVVEASAHCLRGEWGEVS